MKKDNSDLKKYLIDKGYLIKHTDKNFDGYYYPSIDMVPWLKYDYQNFYVSISFGILRYKDIPITTVSQFNTWYSLINESNNRLKMPL